MRLALRARSHAAAVARSRPLSYLRVAPLRRAPLPGPQRSTGGLPANAPDVRAPRPVGAALGARVARTTLTRLRRVKQREDAANQPLLDHVAVTDLTTEPSLEPETPQSIMPKSEWFDRDRVAAVLNSLNDVAGVEVQDLRGVFSIQSQPEVEELLRYELDLLNHARFSAEDKMEDPFYVIDLGQVARKFVQWHQLLPRVHPHYAVKCNNNVVMLRTLAALGANFDCASAEEIQQVLDCGVTPDRIIFANPCKQASHIRFARKVGVRVMTFDNEDELRKVRENYPDAHMVLRIITDDSRSVCRFSSKFGADMSTVERLLLTARDLGVQVVGVSFHVGSGCFDVGAYPDALASARRVFDMATEIGHDMTLLDIGGGFPGTDNARPAIEDIATAMTPMLEQLFPPHVRVISEPGRYFAHSTHILATRVIARRDNRMFAGKLRAQDVPHASVVGADATATTANTDHNVQQHASPPDFLYYVNDGVYGSMNCLLYDHAHVTPILLPTPDHPAPEHRQLHRSTLFGPTCDALDCIARDINMPELVPGDWLYFRGMGAYTQAAASRFNGFFADCRLFVNTFQYR